MGTGCVFGIHDFILTGAHVALSFRETLELDWLCIFMDLVVDLQHAHVYPV